MSIVSETLKCDWPDCQATIALPSGAALSDRYWQGKCFVDFRPTYHACPEHRFRTSDEFREALEGQTA